MDKLHNSDTNNKQIFKKIKIITINVNSIIKNQRRASLLNLIKMQNPDIILLNETKLGKSHVMRFEQYAVIRNDRNEDHPGGGTAILIKKSIKFSFVTLPEKDKGKILENTIIKLNTITNEAIFIIAAYARCGAQKEFIPELKRVFHLLKLSNLENYYILAGDLNAKHTSWKNINNNARGISLKKWIDENSITHRIRLLCSRYPSYPNGNSHLDIVIADSRIIFH